MSICSIKRMFQLELILDTAKLKILSLPFVISNYIISNTVVLKLPVIFRKALKPLSR